jgi:hypothetical protein
MCWTSLLFHDALQWMLMLARVVHHLRHLGVGDLIGIDSAFPDAVGVNLPHDPLGVLERLVEKLQSTLTTNSIGV